MCLAPCFFLVSPVTYPQGQGTIPALGDLPFSGQLGAYFQGTSGRPQGPMTCYKGQRAQSFAKLTCFGGQGSLVSFALYLCTPPPPVVMGELMKPPPSLLLTWAPI